MTEPRITVTEGDRLAAAKAMPWNGDNAKRWIETGFPAGARSFKAIDLSYAIARARTMAAFEERCAAIRKAKRWMVNGVVVDIAGITHAALEKTGILVGRRIEDITDDDIRALVLAGWEVTT